MNNWPQVAIDMSKSSAMCFACGRDNPMGLKLSFRWEDKTATAEFTPSEFHQGWAGVVHGGIISCVLDEAMTYAPYFEHINCITARMDIRLRRLAMVGEPLIITSTITGRKRKLVETKAAISLKKDGTLVAEGTATMFIVDARPGMKDEK